MTNNSTWPMVMGYVLCCWSTSKFKQRN